MDLRLSTVVLTTCLLSVLLVTFADAIITTTWCEPGDICLGRGLGLYKNHVIGCQCPDERRQVHEGEEAVYVPSKCTFDFRRRSFQCKPFIREWADKKKNNFI
ncbi:uncharacterized protein [Amphiura filiformis]|uniref:uncharacterized protein n=1 Tax=Amphiura filiformis TaxID=82378 RepID=UPI003B21F320